MPPGINVEYDLNTGPFYQTIVKLGLEDDKMLKKFRMSLRSFSFDYPNFSSLNGLDCIGYIDYSKEK